MLGVYPVAQASVQDCPLVMEVTPAPQADEAALATWRVLPTSVSADTWHTSGVQVGVGKTPAVVDPQTTFPPDVCPAAQATVQVPPAAIDVTPTPQCPVSMKVAPQVVGTAHRVEVAWQVKVC